MRAGSCRVRTRTRRSMSSMCQPRPALPIPRFRSRSRGPSDSPAPTAPARFRWPRHRHPPSHREATGAWSRNSIPSTTPDGSFGVRGRLLSEPTMRLAQRRGKPILPLLCLLLGRRRVVAGRAAAPIRPNDWNGTMTARNISDKLPARRTDRSRVSLVGARCDLRRTTAPPYSASAHPLGPGRGTTGRSAAALGMHRE
jgi:hypothetical protein